jgi:ribosomal protein L40E
MMIPLIVLACVGLAMASAMVFGARAGRRAADVPRERRAEQAPLTRPCPSCGAQIGTHDERCGECGASVAARKLLCPKCGLHVGAVARFCKRCHTQVNGPGAA